MGKINKKFNKKEINEKQMEMLKRYIDTGRTDIKLRNEIVLSYTPLLMWILSRKLNFFKLFPNLIDSEDLYHWCVLGMIQALKTFNIVEGKDQNIIYLTYKIMGDSLTYGIRYIRGSQKNAKQTKHLVKNLKDLETNNFFHYLTPIKITSKLSIKDIRINIEKDYIKKERDRDIFKVLYKICPDRIPLKILKMQYIYGYQLKEIAKILQINLSTIGTLKRRYLEKLRERLNDPKNQEIKEYLLS
jgi:RNA polymerase sigma factor (sigma-70 family)